MDDGTRVSNINLKLPRAPEFVDKTFPLILGPKLSPESAQNTTTTITITLCGTSTARSVIEARAQHELKAGISGMDGLAHGSSCNNELVTKRILWVDVYL